MTPSRTVQNPMQKATTSARSGRRSGGCFAFDNRAKPDAKNDDFLRGKKRSNYIVFGRRKGGGEASGGSRKALDSTSVGA